MIYPCMLKMHIICPCHMHCITPHTRCIYTPAILWRAVRTEGWTRFIICSLRQCIVCQQSKMTLKLGCYTTNFFLLNENKLSICSRPVKSNRLSARRLAGLFELKFYVLCVDANQRIKSKVFL